MTMTGRLGLKAEPQHLLLLDLSATFEGSAGMHYNRRKGLAVNHGSSRCLQRKLDSESIGVY